MVLCEKAVHILRENKTFHDIVEIFRLYISLLEKVQSNDVGFYKKQYDVFCDLLQEEKKSIVFCPEIYGGHRVKVYLRGEYFSSKRRERGFTQEEVSEDICMPETYSRLERGERKPTRKNSKALAEKLGINWVQFRGELFTTDLEVYRLRRLERRASIEGRWNDSLEILHTLESYLDMNVIENYQYVKACECVSMLQLKKISTEEACSKLEELLDMTCVLDIDDSHLVYYSQTEMEIIADLALLYKRLGNVSKGIKLIENVIKQMSHSQLGYEDQWNGFSYLFRMLARLYFENEDYDNSIAISKYIKSVMIQRRNGYNLPEVLDEIADGLEHQGEQYSEEYRKLYRYTFYVADFFGIEKAKKFAQQYYEEKFDSGIVWYIN